MGTPQLLLLGIGDKAVSLAWLAGPLSGLIVQPLVGFASDACTSPYGRRRPFLVAGTLFTACSLLLFANAVPIARLLVSAPFAPRLALALSICAFFLLDFSIQAIQAPLRALVTDVVPRRQRAFANSYIGVFTGLGNLVGGLLTAVDLKRLLPIFPTHVQALFAAATIVLIFTVLLCVVYTPEEPLRVPGQRSVSGYEFVPDAVNYDGSPQRAAADAPNSTGGLTTALLQSGLSSDASLSSSASSQSETRDGTGWSAFKIALRNVPRPFWQVFAVQLCTWCGFFTLFVYVNTWVGRNVYLGDATAPDGSLGRGMFEKGVRLGGKGNALTALVTLGYALLLPSLLKKFGIVAVYAFSQMVEAGSLLAAPFIRGVPGQTEPSSWLRLVTLADIGMFGVVWATTMGVPWTLIGDALESDRWYAKRVGLFTTLFNASQSFPQLFVAFIAPAILASARNDPSYVMFVGGLCAVLGIVLVFALNLRPTDDPADEELGEAAVLASVHD